MLSFYLAMLDNDGEKERFEILYNKYKVRLSKYAYYLLRDEDLAFNAVSSAFIAVAKNMKTFSSSLTPECERAYLYKSVKNYAINEANKRKRRRIILDIPDYEEIPSSDTPADEIITNEEINKIMKVIEGMKETHRDLLTFKYVYGMNPEEISEITGIPLNTVKSQLRRSIAMLQECFAKEEEHE